MGKRSDFARVDRDFYQTPMKAVWPLLPHLAPGSRYIEPCAGDGALIDHLARAGHRCMDAFDIVPCRQDIRAQDALTCGDSDGDLYITNPPWTRSILHPLIVHLSDRRPCWLLFDADWKHTVQAVPYLPRLRKIVSVGRVIWIPGTKQTGKDNCAWHLFDLPRDDAPPIFIGRTVTKPPPMLQVVNYFDDILGCDNQQGRFDDILG